MTYNEFIRKFNSKEITRFCFRIRGYPHYDNCEIFYQTDKISESKYVEIIVCKLTQDDYETVSFYKQFDEAYKMFDKGRKGKFTLKQVWGLIEVIEVV